MNSSKFQENYIVGENWLYYKIYTGPKIADTVLLDVISPITKQLLNKKIINKWFFIRYSDPDEHLRIRFNFSNTTNIGLIVCLMSQGLRLFFDQKLIWKIQTDTYTREIKRYGSNTIELAEDYFYHDSEMIVELISLLKREEADQYTYRWLFSLRGIDNMLTSFGYKDEQKHHILESLKNNFGQEFGMARPLKKQIDKKYRTHRELIYNYLSNNIIDDKNQDNYSELFKRKEESCKDIVDEILLIKDTGKLEVDFNSLISSYIHMFMNRVFTSANRIYELVCYDFLYRYYDSKIAIKKITE